MISALGASESGCHAVCSEHKFLKLKSQSTVELGRGFASKPFNHKWRIPASSSSSTSVPTLSELPSSLSDHGAAHRRRAPIGMWSIPLSIWQRPHHRKYDAEIQDRIVEFMYRVPLFNGHGYNKRPLPMRGPIHPSNKPLPNITERKEGICSRERAADQTSPRMNIMS